MKKHSINIKSEIGSIHEVERFVEDVCDYYNINNSYFGNILIALTEAVENAIFHGNGNQPSKMVKIQFESHQKGVTFTIEDEGNGFDPSQVPDATDFEGNPAKKGTGLFLMKSLTDDLKYTGKGNKVMLTFNITSINQEIYMNRLRQVNDYLNVGKKVTKQ